MDKQAIVITGGEDESIRRITAAIRHEQAMENIRIIGALHNAGIPVELAAAFGAKPLPRKPEPPRQKSQADLDRIAAAEAKRQRKTAKRSADTGERK